MSSVATRVDALVVGAGPAGSATALTIKRRLPSARVVLAERARFPRDKSCGDGLGPGAVKQLQAMGLEHILESAQRLDHVEVRGPDGLSASGGGGLMEDRRPLKGFVLPRLELDHRLVQAAVDEGCELWEGTSFRGTKLSSTQRIVSLRRDGVEIDVGTSLLVGADGAHSLVRTSLGVPTAQPRHTHVAIRSYADVRFETPALRLDFIRELLPAYGWVFPTSASEANVGVGMPLKLMKDRGYNPRTLLKRYVSVLRDEGVEISEPRNLRGHHLPHAAKLPPLAHERGALVGDAANMINSLSGEGIFYGMAAGEMLGDAVGEVGLSYPRVQEGIERYERTFVRRFRSHLLNCYAAHQMLRSSAWARVVIGAASKDEAVMRDAVELLFGEGHIRAGTTGRILLQGLRRG